MPLYSTLSAFNCFFGRGLLYLQWTEITVVVLYDLRGQIMEYVLFESAQYEGKDLSTESLHGQGTCVSEQNMFLYNACIHYPVRWTAQSALHFNPWQTCLFQHQLNFSVKWTGSSWRERKCPNFETVAKEGFKPGLYRLRDRHSTAEQDRFKHTFKHHF